MTQVVVVRAWTGARSGGLAVLDVQMHREL